MGLIDNNSLSFSDPSFYEKKRKAEKEAGRELTREEFIKDFYTPVGGCMV